MVSAMTYRIIETPDHLHHGLHLFAAANLETVLDWLDTQVLEEHRLPVDERWLLASIMDHGLTRDTQTRRLLARKEAQQFFKKHPEMRKGATYRTAPYPWEGDPYSSAYDREAKEWWAEYEEFEYSQDIHGQRHVADATENLRSVIRRGTVSAIANEIESLTELLFESGVHDQPIVEAIDVIHELFVYGANDSSRYLDCDADEAFEVTQFCRGQFRRQKSKSVDALRTMSPTEFECLCAELVGQFGLTDVTLTPVVADGGVDIVAFQVLDGSRIKYIVQCKRHSMTNRVDVRVVREVAGVKMDARADRAVVITTSEFTKPARDFARRTRAHSWGVRLVDHKLLKRLLDCTD